MKRRSIFIKIFGAILGIALLLLFSVYFLYSQIIEDYNIEILSQRLKKISMSIEPQLRLNLIRKNENDIRRLIPVIGKSAGVRLTVIRPDGVVLADSDEKPEKMNNHKNRPEIQESFQGNTGTSIRYSQTVEKRMLYVSIPVMEKNQALAVIRSSMYVQDIGKLLGGIKHSMLKILFIIIIISFAVSFFISKSLANPIKYLVHASQSVASGNFMTKIELKSMDEFRDLAESFNYMTSKINDLFRQLSLEEEELGIIISSIQEGLVALDKEGRILLFNESFAQMMGRGRDFRGKYYWEALRNEDFINSVHQIMKRENDINSAQLPVEIILDQRFYHLGISYIESKEEYVIIFHDITELRKLECIKKDFVTNVSHELRTPLTAIKGFSETLHAKEENAAKKHYLEIILRHTDRLILIVQDLLLLSRLEEKKLALDVEELDISKVIHNALKLFEKKIVKKNLKLDIVFEKKLPRIQGDLGKLEQLFINLIDNAIKYTDKGRIRIETARAEGGVSIVLEDSGIGIPQDMQERVFERFFVVDKSRSRKQGSTGLGLAIVKHIVNLHHGSIGVKSQLNKGTALSIYLPQQQVQAGDTNG